MQAMGNRRARRPREVRNERAQGVAPPGAPALSGQPADALPAETRYSDRTRVLLNLMSLLNSTINDL